MKSILNLKHGAWIDLESPTPDEVTEAAAAAGIDHKEVGDLLSPSARHKAEFGEHHAYIILHFPAFKDASTSGDAAYEVDFIITKHAIITTHYEKIESLEGFQPNEDSIEGVFFGLLGVLIGNFESKLSAIDHWVRDIEKKMFSGHEKHTIFELSEASRHLIDFKKITAAYPEVLESMMRDGGKVFGKKFETHAEETLARFDKASRKLEIHADTVRELRDTNNSLLTTKQNESMKTLTLVTVIATVIVGIALIWIGIETIR